MIFSASKKNRTIKYVCMSYLHYSWNEPEVYNTLLDVLVQGLNESDGQEARPFFVLAQYLLQKVGGDKSENRFERTMLTFIDTLERNRGYYKFMEQAFEFIFKLAGATPHVAIWFQANKDKWEILKEWCHKITYPLNTMDSNVRLNKRKNVYAQYP